MLQLLVLAAPVAILIVVAWQHRWVTDDAFIDFRIVKQMRAGNGPVFNAGERVEAGTSPFWLMILFIADLVLPLRLEWIAVLLGIGLTAAAFVFAQRGASILINAVRPGAFVVPFGTLLLVALPPMWDFSTSGLETGLSFAWLGACFWGLAREYQLSLTAPEPMRPSLWLCVLISLGPLVRPDFTIYAVAFAAAAFVVAPGMRWPERATAAAVMLAIPVASELFRMAYYGILVPNTALTKESSLADWAQGRRYFTNYVRPYQLWIPFLIAATIAVAIIAAQARRDIRRLAVIAAPIVGAAIQSLYVVRVGGDFMHARMLLPPTFAALLPLAVIVFEGWFRLAFGALVVWAAVCALSLREPYSPSSRITVERRYWQMHTGIAHPVTVNEFRQIKGYQQGAAARTLEANRKRVLILLGSAADDGLPLGAQVKQPVVVQAGSVGVAGYVAPTNAYVIDTLGLADPIGSRLKISGPRGRPGHEKVLPLSWILARFSDDDATPDVLSARHAMTCGDLRRLFNTISGPLGASDVLSNIWNAPRLTRLRVPPRAQAAVQQLCGSHQHQ